MLDCRDHSCWFALDKSGQRTNGGCRCLREIPQGLRSQIIVTLQAKVAAAREQCAKTAEEIGQICGCRTHQVIAAKIRKDA